MTEEKQSKIDEAKQVLADLDRKIAERKELLAKEEAFYAERMVSGKAEAGQPEEKKKPETPKEYLNRIRSSLE